MSKTWPCFSKKPKLERTVGVSVTRLQLWPAHHKLILLRCTCMISLILISKWSLQARESFPSQPGTIFTRCSLKNLSLKIWLSIRIRHIRGLFWFSCEGTVSLTWILYLQIVRSYQNREESSNFSKMVLLLLPKWKTFYMQTFPPFSSTIWKEKYSAPLSQYMAGCHALGKIMLRKMWLVELHTDLSYLNLK